MCLGEIDFAAAENYRRNDYFQTALDTGRMRSRERVSQGLDESTESLLPLTIAFLANVQVPITPLFTGHVSLDFVADSMNNETVRKQGVSRAYKGLGDYTRLAAYLDNTGGCLGNKWRESK